MKKASQIRKEKREADQIAKAKIAAARFHQLKAEGRNNASLEYNEPLEKMMASFK